MILLIQNKENRSNESFLFFVKSLSDIVTGYSCLYSIFAHHMCSYQTLYHSDKSGYIIRCEECEKIQLAYSNLVITFERADFAIFRTWILKIRNERGQPLTGSPVTRSIMIPSPCQGIQLLLSYNELNELCSMLEEADTELQSLDLLKLFADNNISNDL